MSAPAWARVLLRCVAPGERREDMLGDLDEVHHKRRRSIGPVRAWFATGAESLAIVGALLLAKGRYGAGSEDARLSPGALFGDLRDAFRGVLRRPLFSVVVIGTLGIGIGATTAIFTVVNAILLQPLPYEQSDRLVRILSRFEPASGFESDRFAPSIPEYLDYRDQNRTLADVGAYRVVSATITGEDHTPERTLTVQLTPNTFDLLAVEPARGRAFTEAEGLPGATPVVLLAAEYWRSRYGADPAVLGQDLHIDGVPHEVIGIMAAGFRFPREEVNLWVPLPVDPANPGSRGNHSIDAIGRLADGESMESAAAEMDALMAAWAEDLPEFHVGHPLYFTPFLQDMVRELRPALQILLGASVFVLLVVCSNVASIMLARGEDRSRELALRSALGASRGRIAQLVLGECLVLSSAGGALGLGLAWAFAAGLVALQPGGMPRLADVQLDVTVLWFAFGVTLIATVLCALVPALAASSRAPAELVLSGDTRTTAGRYRVTARRSLVAVEVAMAFILVVGAGLLARSFFELTAVDPGFDASGVLLAGIHLPEADYPDDEHVRQFLQELERQADNLPGVGSAAMTTVAPMYVSRGWSLLEIDGRVPDTDEADVQARFSPIAPGFLEIIRARLLEGRTFREADTREAEHVALVSTEFVRRYFAGQQAVGQRIRVQGSRTAPARAWMTVVGVVDDLRSYSLDREPDPIVYSPMTQTRETFNSLERAATLTIRTGGSPTALVEPVRQLLERLDPALPLIEPTTLELAVNETLARPRFTARLLGLFALVGLALGASGIYGVLAYTTAQRTREIGIRKALGARAQPVALLVVREGMVPVAVGLVAGAIISIGLREFLASILYGVSATDPTTLLGAVVILGCVALLACLGPILRAVRLDPLVALRSD
ncbi:MAG: FtsX-like permease family protein [Acidobacteria bacterium]|nr:FtsX-like permease family protein [Acidobacteriota bacterium]